MTHDITTALAAIKNRRNKSRGRAAKSAYRKWMEVHELALREKVEKGEMSWIGLADWMWEHGYRTAENTRVTQAMLQAAWTRIQASRRMTERNYRSRNVTEEHRPTSGAKLGRAPALSDTFELKTLGEGKKK